MADSPPSSESPRPRWPLILGGLVGGFLLVAVGLGLGWYLFYRPVVNVAVQLPAPPAPPALPGPDAAQIKALDAQIDTQKAATKQIEDQIAALIWCRRRTGLRWSRANMRPWGAPIRGCRW